GPEGSFLITINQQNGAIEILGQISDLDTDFSAIAVNSKLTRNVPTMSEYGLIVTVVLLLGASVLYLRRRKLTTEN
ncbi:MAG: IPTL-CTERM sorting domain-containing protein, partial [Thermodesulfobacteriota bacterium]